MRILIALVSTCIACGGTTAPEIVDAGNGCIVTLPPPADQQCIFSVTTSSAAACGTTRDASVPDATTCTDLMGNGCFSTSTCMKVCGMMACQPGTNGDPNTVSCGNYCM